MKKIPLTQNQYALVDDQDYEWLSQRKWFAVADRSTFYAARKENSKRVLMHRLIVNAPKGLVVDHINQSGLDNQRSNLRLCTIQQNTFNRRVQHRSKSGLTGVTWYKPLNKWVAHIRHNGKLKSLGYFQDKHEAAEAYNQAAIKLRPEHAKLNPTAMSEAP